MHDFIERSDAIAAIKTNGVYGSGHSDEERENDVISTLESVPSANVQSVVLCRNCKYWKPGDEDNDPYCRFHRVSMQDDDYCSYGKETKQT